MAAARPLLIRQRSQLAWAIGGHTLPVMIDELSEMTTQSRPSSAQLLQHFVTALFGQGLLLALSLKWPRLTPGALWTLLFWTFMLYMDLRRLYVSRRAAFGASIGCAAILAGITVIWQLASA
jgi:hypothetical protein